MRIFFIQDVTEFQGLRGSKMLKTSSFLRRELPKFFWENFSTIPCILFAVQGGILKYGGSHIWILLRRSGDVTVWGEFAGEVPICAISQTSLGQPSWKFRASSVHSCSGLKLVKPPPRGLHWFHKGVDPILFQKKTIPLRLLKQRYLTSAYRGKTWGHILRDFWRLWGQITSGGSSFNKSCEVCRIILCRSNHSYARKTWMVAHAQNYPRYSKRLVVIIRLLCGWDAVCGKDRSCCMPQGQVQVKKTSFFEFGLMGCFVCFADMVNIVFPNVV